MYSLAMLLILTISIFQVRFISSALAVEDDLTKCLKKNFKRNFEIFSADLSKDPIRIVNETKLAAAKATNNLDLKKEIVKLVSKTQKLTNKELSQYLNHLYLKDIHSSIELLYYQLILILLFTKRPYLKKGKFIRTFGNKVEVDSFISKRRLKTNF
jgi:hypothetical protein